MGGNICGNRWQACLKPHHESILKRYNEIQYHAICRFEKPQAFWAATWKVRNTTYYQTHKYTRTAAPNQH